MSESLSTFIQVANCYKLLCEHIYKWLTMMLCNKYIYIYIWFICPCCSSMCIVLLFSISNTLVLLQLLLNNLSHCHSHMLSLLYNIIKQHMESIGCPSDTDWVEEVTFTTVLRNPVDCVSQVAFLSLSLASFLVSFCCLFLHTHNTHSIHSHILATSCDNVEW